METYDLHNPYGESFEIELKPGMAWGIYMDEGPGSPCGQSMSVTCPHSAFLIFDGEEQLRKHIEKCTRRGKNARFIYGVIGEYTAGGRGSIRHYTLDTADLTD